MKFYKITEEGFSFHTFELTKQITYEEYRKIKNTIYEFSKEEKHRAFKVGCCLISEIHKFDGTVIKLFENPEYPPYLQLRVNPLTVCGHENPIGIFPCTPENIRIVECRINQMLRTIQANYRFQQMTLSRIDLCVNLQMSQSYINAYMRVIRKCKLPESYRRDWFHKDEEDYKEKNKYSFRAANNSVTFTIYDKIYQAEHEKLLLPEQHLESGLMRFEVALNRDVIYRNNEHFQSRISNNSDLLHAYGLMSEEIIKKYVFKFFPQGNYSSYDLAKEAIQGSGFKKMTKMMMSELLKETSEHSNLSNALRDMKLMASKPGKFDLKINRVLNNFEKLRYNPVTTLGETLPGIRELLGFTDGIEQKGRSKFDVQSAGSQAETAEG